MTTGPRPPLSPSLHRVESIDALRGLAALAVVIYHAREIFWIGEAANYRRHGLSPDFNAWLGHLSLPFSYGALGVTLFFVLSGYCIHRRGARMLAKDPGARLDLSAFAIRRFWRIYPTYIAALVVTAILDWIISFRPEFRIPGQDNSVFALGVSLLTLQGYVAPFFGSNGVFWTLAMEVHLYLAYPLLFVLSRRYGPVPVVFFTLLVGLVYLALNGLFGFEQYLPYRFQRGPVFLPFWFTWALGFYLAEVEAGRARDGGPAFWGAAAGLGSLGGFALGFSHDFAVADMAWALFFAALLHWSLSSNGIRFWNGWLGQGLAFVGVFSYSLYAIHGPVLRLCYDAVVPDPTFKFETLWPAFGAVGIAVCVAWIFFQLVERWSLMPPRPRAVLPTKELCRG